MPVAEMLQRMDSREIAEWMAHFKVEEERREIDRLQADAARNNQTRKKPWQR
jgi:hypothetical protein